MGRFFALALHLPDQIETKTKQKRLPARQSNFGIWIALFLGVIGICYLFAVNSIPTKGYEIKKLEKQLVELREVNKRLELEAASLKSIQNLETTVKTLNLVPSKGVNYLQKNGYAFDSGY